MPYLASKGESVPVHKTVRAATVEDYPRIRELMALAFPTEDEALLWDHLVANDAALKPEGVRLALAGGRPVACTVVLPRMVRARRGFVPGAIVTLVACDPAFQNQGYGGMAVRDALAYMKEQGLALGVLFGHPGYYPRFGFVPVLGHPSTTVTVERVTGEAELRAATEADLSVLAGLFEQNLAVYPGVVGRPAEPWLWRPRHPEKASLLALPGGEGYALVSAPDSRDFLFVHEGAADDVEDARRLLAGLAAEARRRGRAKVRLGLAPDQLLARLALSVGAEQAYRPAGPGMAVVTNWEELLPAGYRVTGQGLAYEGRLLLEGDRTALTRLALGYRSVDDLLLGPGCRAAEGQAVPMLRRDFPATFPTWFLAPFWH